MFNKMLNAQNRVRVLNDQYKWTIEAMRGSDDQLDKTILNESAQIIGEEFFRAVAERNFTRMNRS